MYISFYWFSLQLNQYLISQGSLSSISSLLVEPGWRKGGGKRKVWVRNIPRSTSSRTQCGGMRNQVKDLKSRKTLLLCAKVKSSVKRLKSFINAKNKQQQCPLQNNRRHQTPLQDAGMTICKKLVANKSLNILL